MKPGNRKLSRRDLGRLVAGSGLAAAISAQPPQQKLSREEELRAANERRLKASQTLAKFDLPIATEPAFVFRP